MKPTKSKNKLNVLLKESGVLKAEILANVHTQKPLVVEELVFAAK